MDLRCTQPDLYRSPQRSQEKPDPSRRQRTGKIPAWSDRSDKSRSSQQTPGLNRSSEVYIELNSIQRLNQMTATSATRERLVQAAQEELIQSHGHLEMQAVAKRAQVSVGLAYHHFGSKAGLIAAVVEAFYSRLDEEVFNDAGRPSKSWAHRERRRIASYIA